MISCKHDDIHTACGLRNIPIRYAGLLRHCVSRNDERVGHPHPIGIAVPGDSYVATLL